MSASPGRKTRFTARWRMVSGMCSAKWRMSMKKLLSCVLCVLVVPFIVADAAGPCKPMVKKGHETCPMSFLSVRNPSKMKATIKE